MMNRRTRFKVGLSSLYIPYYDKLCALLPEPWQPYSGVRDFPQQDQLYAKGRTQEPLGKGFVVTNAKGGESAHNYGCATDWTIFIEGKPLWLFPEDPRWEVYISAVKKAGLKPGSEFGDYAHNELRIDCSWKHILLAYNAGNMTSAQNKIQESMSR